MFSKNILESPILENPLARTALNLEDPSSESSPSVLNPGPSQNPLRFFLAGFEPEAQIFVEVDNMGEGVGAREESEKAGETVPRVAGPSWGAGDAQWLKASVTMNTAEEISKRFGQTISVDCFDHKRHLLFNLLLNPIHLLSGVQDLAQANICILSPCKFFWIMLVIFVIFFSSINIFNRIHGIFMELDEYHKK